MEGTPWRKFVRVLLGSMLFISGMVLALPAEATLREVPEAGFAIDVPPWWAPVTPPPQGSVLAVASGKQERMVTVATLKAGPDPEQTIANVLSNTRKWLGDNGYTITEEKPLEQNGLKWTTLWAEGRGTTSTAFWVTVVKGTAYVLRADHKTRRIADDDEISGTLRSFQLMEAVPAHAAPGRIMLNTAGGIHWERIVGPLTTIGVLSIIFVVVLLALRKGAQEKG